MAGLKIDNLSDSLLEYLEGLGLSEEQVQQLIDNISGDLSALQTTDKSSLVAAINELFQSANNGKELIATAIGEPLTAEDTFSAMSNGINGLLSTFKTNMMNNGVSVTGTDKFKQLIDKIVTLADSEGKGIQYDSRTVTPSEIKTGSFDYYALGNFFNGNNSYYLTISDLKFTPSVIIITGSHIYRNETKMTYGVFDIMNNMPYYVICSGGNANLADAQTLSNTIKNAICCNITVSNSMNFPLGFAVNTSYPATLNNFTWYAFGVGEEDTTLRDSLASILEEEGVIVAPEDDMASLISKVDSEFDRQVVPAGNAVASDVASGKTFMNSTGQLLTGSATVASLGGVTISAGSTYTLNRFQLSDTSRKFSEKTYTIPIPRGTVSITLEATTAGTGNGPICNAYINDTAIATNFVGERGNSYNQTFNINVVNGDVIKINMTPQTTSTTSYCTATIKYDLV